MQPLGQRQHSQCSANSAVALLVMTLHRQTTQSRACLLLSVSTGAKAGWGHSPRTRMSSKWISQESPGGQSTSFTQRSKPKGLTGTELCPRKVGLHPHWYSLGGLPLHGLCLPLQVLTMMGADKTRTRWNSHSGSSRLAASTCLGYVNHLLLEGFFLYPNVGSCHLYPPHHECVWDGLDFCWSSVSQTLLWAQTTWKSCYLQILTQEALEVWCWESAFSLLTLVLLSQHHIK